MHYRVHLFAVVRVEFEVEADTIADAATHAMTREQELEQRFSRPGEQYAESVENWLLVDPLTENPDKHGRRLPDYGGARWVRIE
jgi:hypothetical protein